MNTADFVAVYARYEDRNRLIGFARGSREDIEAYFSEEQGYGLILEPCSIIDIKPGYARAKNILLNKKAKLESELEELNKQIKSVYLEKMVN